MCTAKQRKIDEVNSNGLLAGRFVRLHFDRANLDLRRGPFAGGALRSRKKAEGFPSVHCEAAASEYKFVCIFFA